MLGRRAVIWLKQKTFSIIFQNQSQVAAKDFGWIIPLPGVPTKVEQSEDGFVDRLDESTAPMIEKTRCFFPCYWGPPDAGSPVGDVTPPSVTIWGGGKLGDLSYQVISATSSSDLLKWLSNNNYPLDATLAVMVDSYVQKGWVFFAAKVAGDAQAASKQIAVPAVRFEFDRSKTPVKYPLRISAFGRSAPLDTTVWVIAEDNATAYKPKGYPTEKMPDTDYADVAAYQAAGRTLMAQNGGSTFVVQYAQAGFGSQRPMVIAALKWGAPKGDLEEIVKNNLFVTRLAARLEPTKTSLDLDLEKAPNLRVDGWYRTGCPNGVIHEKCSEGAGEPMPDFRQPPKPKDAGPDGPHVSSDGPRVVDGPRLADGPRPVDGAGPDVYDPDSGRRTRRRLPARRKWRAQRLGRADGRRVAVLVEAKRPLDTLPA